MHARFGDGFRVHGILRSFTVDLLGSLLALCLWALKQVDQQEKTHARTRNMTISARAG